ncbi:MAG: pyridoxamine 5'-phosphate oxidase family protein [Pseudomonadota bacterium]
MSDTSIMTIDGLEAQIGKKPANIDLKVIDHLDVGARKWAEMCSLMFIALSTNEGSVATIAGGIAGFIEAEEKRLKLPLTSIDDSFGISPGAGFGSLLVLPGIGETLRINGHISDYDAESITVSVSECYIHCAKAIIRSDFWSPVYKAHSTDDPIQTIDHSRFLALATSDEDGNADLSPKGDPSSALAIADGEYIWLADRPGNRRADSFRNMLRQPKVAGIFLSPGQSQVQIFQGVAEPTYHAMRERLAVQERVPKIATRISIANLRSETSQAIETSRIWTRETANISPSKILGEHLKLNKKRSVSARIVGTVSGIPGVLEKSLEADYKKNLY